MKNFAVLSAMFRLLSRSRAPRSKRHAVGTSPAHKWRSISKLYILLVQEKVGKFRVSEKLEIKAIKVECRVLEKLDIWAVKSVLKINFPPVRGCASR